MTFIRARQRSLTALFPHQGNRRYIIPNRSRSDLSLVNAVTWQDNDSVLQSTTAQADTQGFCFSCWVRFDAAAVVANQGSMIVWQNAAGSTRRCRVDRTTPAERGRNISQNSIGTNLVDAQSAPANSIPNDVVVHLAIAADTSAPLAQVYIDGVAAQNANTPVIGTIDFTGANVVSIARRILAAGAANPFEGRMAEFWFDPAFFDLDSGGIDAFIVNGLPADLGANGENPLGGKPLIYFGGDMKANSGGDAVNGTGPGWNGGANLGSLGGWTMAGPGVVDV